MKIRNPGALASSLGDSATSLLEPEVGKHTSTSVAQGARPLKRLLSLDG